MVCQLFKTEAATFGARQKDSFKRGFLAAGRREDRKQGRLRYKRAAQKLRNRKNLFVFDTELVTICSEPTTTTGFVTSSQFAGESTFSD